MNSSSYPARIRGALSIALISFLSAGCYLLESIQGQLSVMSAREPIRKVLDRPTTSPMLRGRLEAVVSIREFASRALGLPDNGSYRSYANIARPYVVWNVVAAPEFSVDAREWCFPIVGCVAYRGYFTEARARNFAAQLKRSGLDVSVAGVAAYSTLGHFDDPILSSMLGWNDIELAAIIFHELAHQLLYIPNDASFNEAFAMTIEEEGVRRWLLSQGRDADLERRRVEQQRYVQIVGMVLHTRDELRIVYASGVDAGSMRDRKAAAFRALQARYARLKADWGGQAPLGYFFTQEINNGYLASIATYFDCVPGLQRELNDAGGNLSKFYTRVRSLAKLDRASRDNPLCRN